MSELGPETYSPNLPMSGVEEQVGIVQATPSSSDEPSSATNRTLPAAKESSSLYRQLSSASTQAVPDPSGEGTPSAGKMPSNVGHATSAFDDALPEELAKYGRISFEGSCNLSLSS